MSRTRIRLLLGPALVPLLVTTFLIAGRSQVASSSPVANRILSMQLNIELGKEKAPFPKLQHLSSGVMYTLLDATGELAKRASDTNPGARPVTDTLGCAVTKTGGLGGNNVRVNQDCSLRRQAEEAIAINPHDRKNLIAGQNDSRVGFNHCGYDFSLDGGVHWGDLIPPFYQFQFDPADPFSDTADACSDPTATFDSQGNAFIGGILFNIDNASSAVIVARSDAELRGSFFHDPDQSDAFHQYDVPRCVGGVCSGIVRTDPNNFNVFNDKELMVADANPDSPKSDNVYMTWTFFEVTEFGVGIHSPIYFSQSTNGGAAWSDAIEISGSNKKFCTAFSAEKDPSACDQDQGSHPIVGPDGTIYVAFGNGNTPTPGINQHMVVSCPASADCSSPSSWTPPVKISDDFGTQPTASITDPVTGCPAGRQCLPPNGYRLDDFTEGSISVDNSGRLYFAWADGRNIGPPCDTGDYATSDPPCNNDVFYSFSVDGGATWSGAFLVTANGGETAQWQPWSGVTGSGKRLWIAYYDRKYGNCEFDGCNDITLVEVLDPRGAKTLSFTRLTTSSMPNLVLANNPLQAGFLGDYMWLTVDKRGIPYVVWADTRGRDGAVEEDVYFATGGA